MVQLASATGLSLPLEGVQVRYSYHSTAGTDQPDSGATLTDANGEFTFDPITIYASDEVIVIAEAPGYDPLAETRTGPELIASDGIYEFVLQPLGTTQKVTRSTATRPLRPCPGPSLTPVLTSTPIVDAPPLTQRCGRTYSPAGYQFWRNVHNVMSLC
jgi:hypothetical protein